MIIKNKAKLTEADVTPEEIYRARRHFMKGSIALGATAMLPSMLVNAKPSEVEGEFNPSTPDWLRQQIHLAKENSLSIDESLTPYQTVTQYNNFYEFGYNKEDPEKNSGKFQPYPWQVEIAGEVAKPGQYALEDLLKGIDLEERIYRLRCVEAWSMVIPWIGFPLASLLKRFEPTSRAKYVAFTSVMRPKEMPAQDSVFSSIEWPYVEGLRIDEAMHPLTMIAVGLYGKSLPNQNGAPFRLVVPWKYGFKSIKSVVKIELRETEPPTTWSQLAPNEYGFYANVNPNVDHPRWSQAEERRLPSGLFRPNIIPTKMFNGYEEVASLYQGMDLRKNY
ncbi:protein-methionine-sulfoxide reductase catalytic subunit MsrP [Vibrio viridaestus]|uniref:Protein-methionine-sulfoxide reductase catalytic subunit MsrP n=1 Tax=Vibrio viridaestus TaxID=2487322 RepID=A0A3N9TEV7_9VIBR|nr:protein-methionine-sulfoxide reductase catalytic subunit MsrP [Vibrio viridaestus]RQW62404.1 protein-methionine-sulfoxide reductase catalytic subunit MsrP [Vibrio viridaestus]